MGEIDRLAIVRAAIERAEAARERLAGEEDGTLESEGRIRDAAAEAIEQLTIAVAALAGEFVDRVVAPACPKCGARFWQYGDDGFRCVKCGAPIPSHNRPYR
jgi:tRNA(Ile2) C34 agmatinyltransferase TiaS